MLELVLNDIRDTNSSQRSVMAAVVRLKRLLEEEPLDALVINCKRRKTEPNEPVNESIAAVLKFAGTVKNEVRYGIPNLILNFFVLLGGGYS